MHVEPDRLQAALQDLLGDRTDRFVVAGLAALDGVAPSRSWVHFGLAPRIPDIYAEVSKVVPQEGNWFFMHKPPGLRLRFENGDAAALSAELERLGEVTQGVYEPEELLFGGPTSMPFVHRLFTVDSRAWLGFHQLSEACPRAEEPKASQRARSREATRHGETPKWAYSLALLRHVFNGLGISGWEDLEVWQRIRRQAYRTLPSGLAEERVRSVTAAIRDAWADPQRLRASLSPKAAELAAAHGQLLVAAGEAWLQGYFGSHAALIGPREGAAFFTIFHWNRGALSAVTQALIAEALADRRQRP